MGAAELNQETYIEFLVDKRRNENKITYRIYRLERNNIKEFT
jgi:hypothetical protein